MESRGGLVVLQTLEYGTVDDHLCREMLFQCLIIQCKMFFSSENLFQTPLLETHLVVLEFPSNHPECVVDEVVVDVNLKQSAPIFIWIHLYIYTFRTLYIIHLYLYTYKYKVELLQLQTNFELYNRLTEEIIV